MDQQQQIPKGVLVIGEVCTGKSSILALIRQIISECLSIKGKDLESSHEMLQMLKIPLTATTVFAICLDSDIVKQGIWNMREQYPEWIQETNGKKGWNSITKFILPDPKVRHSLRGDFFTTLQATLAEPEFLLAEFTVGTNTNQEEPMSLQDMTSDSVAEALINGKYADCLTPEKLLAVCYVTSQNESKKAFNARQELFSGNRLQSQLRDPKVVALTGEPDFPGSRLEALIRERGIPIINIVNNCRDFIEDNELRQLYNYYFYVNLARKMRIILEPTLPYLKEEELYRPERVFYPLYPLSQIETYIGGSIPFSQELSERFAPQISTVNIANSDFFDYLRKTSRRSEEDIFPEGYGYGGPERSGW